MNINTEDSIVIPQGGPDRSFQFGELAEKVPNHDIW
jgi:hypothetical protein